ncbi:MAG: alpha/beta hydrolase-fold protein [Muribaculaceae bacterium]
MTRIAIALIASLMLLPLHSQEVAKGTIVEFIHNQSTVYPGTVRTVKVYVPQQYSGKRPACLLVCMDGILYDAAAKMDTLIAGGDMPVAIGVFVEPGVVKDGNGEVVRYNRCREFDTVDGTWAHFLEKEILPRVEGMVLPDGRVVHLSADANDRAITGASSGGICAFTAAWMRPDLFSRVYSAVGTFVAMRGGNELPALIRKTDTKPLRIFLQDGEKDAWNALFGSWWEYNQLMMSALQFAGYEVDAAWDKGGHSIRYGTLTFNRAMKFLWNDWPKGVKAGKSDNDMLAAIVKPGEQWQYVADYSAHRDTFFLEPSTVMAHHKGMISSGHYFAVSPNYRTVVQSEPTGNWLVQYVVKGKELTCGERFYWLHSPLGGENSENGPMAFDTLGNLYVATAIGVQVCDHNGRVRAILTLPGGAITGMSFVGHKLYVVCGGKIYCRVMKTTGYNRYDGAIEVKSQGQG